MRGLLVTALLLAGCAIQPATTEPDPFTAVSPVDKVVYDRSARGQILGGVRHRNTGAPLGNALVLLQSSRETVLEATTDDYGRYHFGGLPAGVYTVQVFVGSTTAAQVVALDDASRGVARFSVDPALVRVCSFPVFNPDASLLWPNDAEADLLGIPSTTVYR